MLGAIIITSEHKRPVQADTLIAGAGSERSSWAAVEVLGKAPVIRLAEALRQVCDLVSVVASPMKDQVGRESQGSIPDLVDECFANYKRKGCEAVVIACCGAYVELDIADMLAFHQEQGLEATRAFADDGALDVWIVDPSAVPAYSWVFSASACARSAVYRSQAYVNRLQCAGDLRRLVLDGLHSSCLLRPEGSEIKPGIWLCEGAQIERSARIVAPAFIGRDVRISEECLITRGSNVESNSHIDFGTAVENSSILPNTYVGIGLDLSHSIVDGRNLLNLQHNVSLQITDPVVLREAAAGARARQSQVDVESEMVLSSAE
jgi:carbonic anhydrase/acetyltransferase-like protein (isoleucine patch superfamily)